MFAVMVLAELQHIGTVIGADITLSKAYPVIAKVMLGPAV
jgi:hypothetical protein